MKMMVSQIGFKLSKISKVIKLSINLPVDTKILSVSAEEEYDKHVFWNRFMAPSNDIFETGHREFHFIIVNCKYTEVEINKHKYIGNIDIEDETYAVFFEAGKVIKE